MAKIKYIDSSRLKRAILAGASCVVSDKDYLNKINVFPVPDGDTGTNMVFTLNSIVEGIEQSDTNTIHGLLNEIADHALDGARGNSGAILAQFFQGLNEGYSGDKLRMYPKDLADSVKHASRMSREALSNPVEGTIITVIDDFSSSLNELVNQTECFQTIISEGLKASEKSLNNTPNLLPILKKSGVYDSGAKGFVDFLYGINEYILDGLIERDEDENKLNINTEAEHKNNHNFLNEKEIKYQYCIECKISNENVDIKNVKNDLMNLDADSLVVVGSNKKARIHIHSNNPAKLFNSCQEHGMVSGLKVDDMIKQFRITQSNKNNLKYAVVMDSGGEIPETGYEDINIVPLRYNFGEINHLDKITQTSNDFYLELANGAIHPQTSQPTPGEFIRLYSQLSSHYEQIFSIHIPNLLSGTFQSATTATKKIKNIFVLDSLNASSGLGLVAMYTMDLIKKNYKFEQIISKVKDVMTKTHIFLAVDDLKYAVKGGRISSWKKTVCEFLGVKPILTVNDIGKISLGGAILGSKQFELKLSKFITKKIKDDQKYRIIISHCNNLDGAKLLEKYIKSENDKKNIFSLDIVEMGCALGVHAGPGSLSIGIQLYDL